MSVIQNISLSLSMTSVFTEVLKKPLFKCFFRIISSEKKEEKIRAYAEMVGEIYKEGLDLTDTVLKYLYEDENVYVKTRAKGLSPDKKVEEALRHELSVFSDFAALTSINFSVELGVGYVSPFSSRRVDFAENYEERMKGIFKHGYGIFAYNRMFRLSDSGSLEPIVSCDKTALSDFVGYKDERKKVIENTKAFIDGRPAANVLLCGDAGTGKSSTVKAVANAFYGDGVRLIELRKDQLSYLPYVMGKISENPLRFIIFIDDLSFNKSDDNFSMLKAALEGSASAKADNAVIYATSNRRHIVKESFGDREGDDVHKNDTLGELLSLSERFGLVILFQKPNKALYLEIVHELAERYGINIDKKTLELSAEEFALRKGSRSARCTEQFIKSLV